MWAEEIAERKKAARMQPFYSNSIAMAGDSWVNIACLRLSVASHNEGPIGKIEPCDTCALSRQDPCDDLTRALQQS